MAEKAYITPKVLKWARESSKISLEEAASKLKIDAPKLKDWEEGRTQPTIRQAKILAKAYKRPFALFFLPEIPLDFQPLQDFRKKGSKKLSTASIFIIREIRQKQSWISEINQENKEAKVPFVGRFSLSDNPEMVAKDILQMLEIDPLNYTFPNPINEWINKAESKGIFVSRTSFIHSRLKLDSQEFQGFAIADPYAPFIFINSDDWSAPQLFTLVHELAHLWIGKSGISNEVENNSMTKGSNHPVELFCNKVAANALMPKEFMISLEKELFVSSEGIYKIVRDLGVSMFAFLFRAYKMELISRNKYFLLKSEAEKGFNEFLKKEREKKDKQKEKKGGPSPYLLRVNKNSRLFTQIVLDAYHGGSVEPDIASLLLNTPVNKFSLLENQIYK